MGIAAFLIIWSLAPLAELAVILGLCIENGACRKKIRELKKRLEEEDAWQEKECPAAKTMEARSPVSRENSRGIIALLVGVTFVVLAGLVFATTAWHVLPDTFKVFLVLAFAGIFFFVSFLAENRFHIYKTGNAFYILGSIFLFLTVLAAAYFRLLGSEYVLAGQNRWRVLWAGSIPTVVMMFWGIRRFHDRIYTQACFWGMTVSVTFLLLGYGTGEWTGFLSGMMVYAFLLAAGGRLWRKTAESRGSLLAEGFLKFAPVHFRVIAFPAAVWGTATGCFQVTEWLHWYGALAMGTMAAGTALYARDAAEKNDCRVSLLFGGAVTGALLYVLAWIRYGLGEALAVSGQRLILDWLDRGLLEFLTLVSLILWNRKRRSKYPMPALIFGTVGQVLFFSEEKISFPFFLVLSAALLSEVLSAREGEKGAVDDENLYKIGRIYRTGAFYAMAGVYLLMVPFTADHPIERIMGVVWVYIACMAAGKRAEGRPKERIKGRENESGERHVFWDIWGCVLVIAALGAFYDDEGLGAGSLILCLVLFGGFYRMFYMGKRVWPHLIISIALLAMPFVLAYRYEWTGNRFYLILGGTMLVTGVGARSLGRICVRDEQVFGGWRIDWFHVIAVFLLLPLAVAGENKWQRFGYWILTGLYFAQYGLEPSWRKWAWPLAALTGVFSFWCQPFLDWPSLLETEICLLPAALYLWCLGRWEYEENEKSPGIQIIQTAGYGICLLILCGDAWWQKDVANALILEGICLGIFLGALAKNCRLWIRISAAVLVAVALYMTKDFWLSISWWVYLLTAGIGLIVFAAVNESKRKEP